jgi:NAD(P)-dependent dehydrogenase (short-subunit alcohol dehydrogenase family)
MDGAVVLVTGATSGLGLAAAERFASLGASVHLMARDGSRGQRACAQIRARSGSDDIHLGICDISDLGAVRRFAGRFAAEVGRLDVLVNNASALLAARAVSANGFELTLATNVLGPFLLSGLLIEEMKRSAPARIINVSSGGMYTQRVDLDDLQSEHRRYDGATVYAVTKRAQVILTAVAATHLADTGVFVHAMHPGWVDTPGLASSLPRFHAATRPLLRTPEQGADTIVWLGATPAGVQSSGAFWHDRATRPTYRLPKTRQTPAEGERLWAQCALLTSPFGFPTSATTDHTTTDPPTGHPAPRPTG